MKANKQECLLPSEKLKKDIFLKRSAKTSEKYGKRPEQRDVEELISYGIVNLDKPSGPTSHQVSSYVQKILNIKKSGHSGTLDPKVTGVLPIALGRATRIVQALLPAGKEYIAIMHLHKEVPREKILVAMEHFTGKIRQLPPIRSSVKRQYRYRKIYYIKVLEFDEKDVLFIVGCQAGTYIRKLIHDIGQFLGSGAHMAELRRTKVGPFNEGTSLVSLQDLSDAYYYYKKENNCSYLKAIIHPVEKAVEHLPKLWAIDSAIDSICHGASFKAPGLSKLNAGIEKGSIVAIMSLKDELVALAEAEISSKEMLKADKGIVAKTKKVFMQPGTYPKIDA